MRKGSYYLAKTLHFKFSLQTLSLPKPLAWNCRNLQRYVEEADTQDQWLPEAVFLSKAAARGVSCTAPAGRVTAEPLNAHIRAFTHLSFTAGLTDCCNIRICFWPCSSLPPRVPLRGLTRFQGFSSSSYCILPSLQQEPASPFSGFSWADPELCQSLGILHWKKLGSVLEDVDRTSLSMLRGSVPLIHSLPKSVGFTVSFLLPRLYETISSLCLLTPSKRAGLIPKMGVFRKSKAY